MFRERRNKRWRETYRNRERKRERKINCLKKAKERWGSMQECGNGRKGEEGFEDAAIVCECMSRKSGEITSLSLSRKKVILVGRGVGCLS